MSFFEIASSLFVIAITAAFAENLFLNQAVGASNVVDYENKNNLMYSVLLIFMMTIVNLPMNIFSYFLNKWEHIYYFTPLIYVISLIVTYFAVINIMKRFFPLVSIALLKHLPYASFSCALMSGVLLSQRNAGNFLETITYALGISFGYVLAMLIVNEGIRRINLADVPVAFKGAPIYLIYVGILCLIVYGISGKRFVF